jgi:hypothetical protein
VRDVVTAAFDRARFEALTEKVAETVEQKVPVTQVNEIVEVTAKRFQLNGTEQKGVLTHFIETGDFSRYGLFNAVTRAAEDVADYDRASELERLGGRIIELPKGEWQEILKAAA